VGRCRVRGSKKQKVKGKSEDGRDAIFTFFTFAFYLFSFAFRLMLRGERAPFYDETVRARKKGDVRSSQRAKGLTALFSISFSLVKIFPASGVSDF
jgi:hypothetical protein